MAQITPGGKAHRVGVGEISGMHPRCRPRIILPPHSRQNKILPSLSRVVEFVSGKDCRRVGSVWE